VIPFEPDDPRRGPFLHLLGMRAAAVEVGRVRVQFKVGPDHLRTRGIAHGGVIATLMDTSLGLAAATKAPNGLDVVTAQINVNFIRPAWEGELLEALAEVRHSGRRTAVVTGEIRTESGTLVATGSATMMFVPSPDLVKAEKPE
jgi:acyl-CoA thioesterase